MDIDAGINIAVSYFGTSPTPVFPPEAIGDAFEGPVRSQAPAEAMGTQSSWVKASGRPPSFETGQKLGYDIC